MVEGGPFSGPVVAAQFIGTDLRLCVLAGGQHEMWARVNAAYAGPCAVGDTVSLDVLPHMARVIR